MSPVFNFELTFIKLDKTVNLIETQLKKRECPLCEGHNIFVFDRVEKVYWCKDCSRSFEKGINSGSGE